MKKGIIIGVFALLLLCCLCFCVLVSFLLITADDDNDKKSDRDDVQEEQDKDSDKVVKEEVKELKTEAAQRSYIEKIVESYEENKGEIEVVMKGEMIVIQGDQEISFDINVKSEKNGAETVMSIGKASLAILEEKDSQYVNDGDTWYKAPIAAAASEGALDENMFNFADIIDSESFNYSGVEECTNSKGDCHVFEFEDEYETVSIIYINESDQIERMEMESPFLRLFMDIDYRSVSVRIPTKYETITEEEFNTIVGELTIPLLLEAGVDPSTLGQ